MDGEQLSLAGAVGSRRVTIEDEARMMDRERLLRSSHDRLRHQKAVRWTLEKIIENKQG